MVSTEALPTSGMNLPIELWIQVICELINDHTTLKNLSLVCRSFRLETERLLFRFVHFSKDKFDGEQIHHTRDFLVQIASSNRISHHIRVIYADLSEPNPEASTIHFKALITGALRAMHNLYHLKLIMGKRIERSMLADLAHKVPFQLERFDTDIGLNDGFAEFVRSQPSLIDIRWLSKEEPSSKTTGFTPQDLPFLKNLHVVDDSAATMFLPHCPVTHACFEPLQFSKLGVVPSVRALMIEGFDISAGRLPSLARVFPNLEYIDLCVHRVSFDQDTLDDLKAFRCLRKLKIWEAEGQWEEEMLFALSSAFMATTSVSCVDVAVRQADADLVNIGRVRKLTGGLSLREELIEDVAFSEYDDEVWRWTGVPE